MKYLILFFSLIILTGIVGKVLAFDYSALSGKPGVENVRDYGAKGDGVTDDTVAIQQAINVTEGTHGTVYMPAGTYKISSLRISNRAGFVLVGDGSDKTKLLSFGQGQPILNITGAWYITLAKFSVETLPNVTVKTGILFTSSPNWACTANTIEDVKITDEAGGAFEIAPFFVYNCSDNLFKKFVAINKNNPSIPVMLLSGKNGFGIVPITEPGLALDMTFLESTFINYQANARAGVVLDGSQQIRFFGGSIKTSNIPGIQFNNRPNNIAVYSTAFSPANPGDPPGYCVFSQDTQGVDGLTFDTNGCQYKYADIAGVSGANFTGNVRTPSQWRQIFPDYPQVAQTLLAQFQGSTTPPPSTPSPSPTPQPTPTSSPSTQSCASPVHAFYYNANSSSVFYTANEAYFPVLAAGGWTDYGAPFFYAYKTQVADTLPVNSFYYSNRLSRYLTTNTAYFPTLEAGGWTNEGIFFYAYSSQVPGTKAVHSFYHPNRLDRFLTLVESYFPVLAQAGYTDEGIAFYAYPTKEASCP